MYFLQSSDSSQRHAYRVRIFAPRVGLCPFLLLQVEYYTATCSFFSWPDQHTYSGGECVLLWRTAGRQLFHSRILLYVPVFFVLLCFFSSVAVRPYIFSKRMYSSPFPSLRWQDWRNNFRSKNLLVTLQSKRQITRSYLVCGIIFIAIMQLLFTLNCPSTQNSVLF